MRSPSPLRCSSLSVCAPAAHLVPLDELITETLDWFDTYLGVPQGT